MRKIALLLAVLLPALALADTPGIRNDSASTTLTGANLTPSMLAVNNKGELFCTASTGAASLGKAEDSPAVSGDTGVMALAVANEALINISGTDGDYTPVGVSRKGAVYVDIQQASQSNVAGSPIKVEDGAAGSGDGAIAIVAVREDALTTSTSTTGDYSHMKVDANGRQIVTNAPPGETFQSCGTATAVTSDVAIKAAVASNRMYVTSITCKNTSITVSSALDFKDGSTIIAVGGIGAQVAASGTDGSFIAIFPVPLRGTVNTAFNFATNTATTSVTCCAHGYISVL